MKKNTVSIKKILLTLLIVSFFSFGFFKVSADFSDFTEDFYKSLHNKDERVIFKNFENYLLENSSEKSMLVKKEFFNMLNDSSTMDKVKSLGVKSTCLYIFDCSILKVFGKISLDNLESVKLAAISLNENFEKIKEYMSENETILSLTCFY